MRPVQAPMSKWSDVEQQLNVMVNPWYETPEIRRLLAVPLRIEMGVSKKLRNHPFLYPSPSRGRRSGQERMKS